MPAAPLTQDQLRRRFDVTSLRFATTDELSDLSRLLGQDRALQSLRFGTGIKQDGYNLFAVGTPGTGKHVIVTEYLQREAHRSPAPDDWCYVNNFADPQRPRALRLPKGRAVQLRDAMTHLIDDLRTAIPAVFESDDYVNRRQMLEGQLRRRHEEIIEQIQERARAKDVALMQTPMGLVFTPVKEGEVLNPETFAKLPEADQARIKTDIEALQTDLQQAMRQLPLLEKEVRDRIRTLNQEVTQRAAGHLIAAVRSRFADLPIVLAYLDAVEKDVVNNALDFIRPLLAGRETQAAGPQAAMAAAMRENLGPDGTPFGRYRVNVLVDNGAATGAPVVFEDHPVIGNVIGRIEHTAMFGTLVTDFNLIKPGALHKANGGYLIL
ncbi:MAG: AAA family ATPase, partial [Alphaproteobacteria bacterium]